MDVGRSRRGPAGAARWTTRRWLTIGVATSGVLLLVLGSLGAWALATTSRLTDEVVRNRTPALISAVRLEAALVNQETGVRGYGLSGRRDFLKPYTQGQAAETTALEALDRLVDGSTEAAADLRTVRTDVRAWQERVAQPIAAASGQDAVRVASDRAADGKRLFDQVRDALARQQDHLRDARTRAGDDLSTAQRLRTWLFTAIALVIAVMMCVIFYALRRGVTGPLTLLGAAAREVGSGRFDRKVPATGPADLQQLAHDVESMRVRLVEELARSEEARVLLDQQAEELKRSNAELEQFAYVASHDLQEPLRKISSFTQLLQRRYGDKLDERADQYIGFAVDGANRMQVLINDLLMFSRVGRVHDQRSVTLEDCLDSAVDALSVAVEESGARIEHDELPTVYGDASQLGLLFQNLLSNAIKFRAPGRPPRIRVSVREEGDMWRFTVRDNGIGIAPEFREKVFVIFQRLHTREAYPGTGIGLAMCKKTVEFHGGTIGVDSVDGEGTSISFTLPLQPSAQTAADSEGSLLR
ncbi:ATP-binding protein [Streptomyces sp. VRA16 Mangrove soil]|uniref:sensor histidine kinase n=1 Tax=Streptomyces sp. VRA16 Mangrove soil TaxID=2817434 RepID=UPI001A9F3F3F|nr:ATP-binding protein [Streptomyces sp. VRA16 Mangrove soil]MBO1330407.1 CHASE3 domain-containing protein [Streptomyces sp. VRA16 Mangrove soil]